MGNNKELEIKVGKRAKAVKNVNHRYKDGEQVEFVGLNMTDYGDECPVYTFKSTERKLYQDLIEGEFEWL